MEGGGLVPVAAGAQEAAHRGGDRDGVQGPPARGGVVRGGVQVRALGFQPGGRLPEGGQVGGMRRRVAGRRAAVGAGPGGEVPAGGQGGVQVVVQQPAGRGVGSGRVVGGGEGAGVLAEQVMQLVAAGCGLGEQVLVIQLIQAAAGLVQAGAVERGGGVGVEAGARDAGRAGGTAAAGLR